MNQLTKVEKRAVFATMRAYLAANEADVEVAKKLGLSYEDYLDLKEEFLKAEIDFHRKRTTEQVYVDYVLAQRGNIDDLTSMVADFKNTKQYNAMVGAVKARAEILDRMIDRGQEFGFIEKKVEPKSINGVLVANIGLNDLRQALLGEVTQLKTLFAQEQNIIDVVPGKVHTDPSEEPKPLALPASTGAVRAKVKGHARNKVHGGRRVKRGP